MHYSFHRTFVQPVQAVTSYEKLAYMWREMRQAAGEDCILCPQVLAVAIAAGEQLQTLRQQVDAFETCYDMERELANRRASGFNALFGSAVMKETDDLAQPYDAESGIRAPAPAPVDVSGIIRKPKKGPEIVEGVRAQRPSATISWTSRL